MQPLDGSESLVIDCSVTMAWYFKDEATAYTNAVRASLATGRAAVPALWPLEVANVLLMGERRKRSTQAKAGQMNLYVNYALHHWTHPDENPPVGLILCAKQGAGVAKYALEGMTNKILASQYRTALPSAEVLTSELERTRKMLEDQAGPPKTKRG
jgi:YhcG PDDEXK nuclease domain